MKMTSEHYSYLKAQIAPIALRINPMDYRKQIVAEGRSKDPDKRVRWDYLWAAKISSWLVDNLYSYLNDDHIDTALKAIMRDLGESE